MEILKEDLPYNLYAMADLVGIEVILEICKVYGGTMVYIPVYDKVIMGDRNREIARSFDGENFHELVARYGISKQHL